MNIFENDIIFEISKYFDYVDLHQLLTINNTFNKILNHNIYNYCYDDILKDLNIKVVLSNYYTKFPHQITHPNCMSFKTGSTIITCTPKTLSIDTIITNIVKNNNFKDLTNVVLSTSTLQFYHPKLKTKYNDLPNQSKGFLKGKIFVYGKVKFKFFKNGVCQVTNVNDKTQKDFLIGYKKLLT